MSGIGLEGRLSARSWLFASTGGSQDPTGGWSKWGSWGLLEWYHETEQEHPKFKAVIEWNGKNAKEK